MLNVLPQVLNRLSPLHLKTRWRFRQVMNGLDKKRWAKMIEQTAHLEKVPQLRELKGFTGALKYLDLERFLRLNIRRYHELRLPKHPLKIADLGCGAGFFAYYASLQGHEVWGLDRPTSPEFDPAGPHVFNLMTDFFEIKKIHHTILPNTALPQNLRGLDLITAFNTWFDGRYEAGLGRIYIPWTVEEWTYFIQDCLDRLKPHGRIFLDVNEKWEFQRDYYYPQELQATLEKLPLKVRLMKKNIIDLEKN